MAGGGIGLYECPGFTSADSVGTARRDDEARDWELPCANPPGLPEVPGVPQGLLPGPQKCLRTN